MISASWRGGVTWYNSGDRTVTGHCETPGVGPQAQTHSPPLLHRHLSAELLLLHWAGLCQRQSAGPQDGAALGLELFSRTTREWRYRGLKTPTHSGYLAKQKSVHSLVYTRALYGGLFSLSWLRYFSTKAFMRRISP